MCKAPWWGGSEGVRTAGPVTCRGRRRGCRPRHAVSPGRGVAVANISRTSASFAGAVLLSRSTRDRLLVLGGGEARVDVAQVLVGDRPVGRGARSRSRARRARSRSRPSARRARRGCCTAPAARDSRAIERPERRDRLVGAGPASVCDDALEEARLRLARPRPRAARRAWRSRRRNCCSLISSLASRERLAHRRCARRATARGRPAPASARWRGAPAPARAARRAAAAAGGGGAGAASGSTREVRRSAGGAGAILAARRTAAMRQARSRATVASISRRAIDTRRRQRRQRVEREPAGVVDLRRRRAAASPPAYSAVYAIISECGNAHDWLREVGEAARPRCRLPRAPRGARSPRSSRPGSTKPASALYIPGGKRGARASSSSRPRVTSTIIAGDDARVGDEPAARALLARARPACRASACRSGRSSGACGPSRRSGTRGRRAPAAARAA